LKPRRASQPAKSKRLPCLPPGMNQNLQGRRRPEQVHGIGHHNGPFIEVMFALTVTPANPVGRRRQFGDQVVEVHSTFPFQGRGYPAAVFAANPAAGDGDSSFSLGRISDLEAQTSAAAAADLKYRAPWRRRPTASN
jgi:hypothetical protein